METPLVPASAGEELTILLQEAQEAATVISAKKGPTRQLVDTTLATLKDYNQRPQEVTGRQIVNVEEAVARLKALSGFMKEPERIPLPVGDFETDEE